MENHKIVLKECDIQRQSDTEVWTDKLSTSRVFSNFEIPWDTDTYKDFIEKTMDYLKSFHEDNPDLDDIDLEKAANDLLLAITLIRWQCHWGVKLLPLVNFLDKQFGSSLHHHYDEQYRRYIESRQKRVDSEANED